MIKIKRELITQLLTTASDLQSLLVLLNTFGEFYKEFYFFLLVVKASDKDATSSNNLISFGLDINSSRIFSIDESGKLTVKSLLDRETLDSYRVIVIVRDSGIPSNSGSCVVNIEVTDVNDTPPTFDDVRTFCLNFIKNPPVDLLYTFKK